MNSSGMMPRWLCIECHLETVLQISGLPGVITCQAYATDYSVQQFRRLVGVVVVVVVIVIAPEGQ